MALTCAPTGSLPPLPMALPCAPTGSLPPPHLANSSEPPRQRPSPQEQRETIKATCADEAEEKELLEEFEPWEELMPQGLLEAYKSIAAEDPSLPAPTGNPKEVINALRVFDIDGSGGISWSDLKAYVKDDARSVWMPSKKLGAHLRLSRMVTPKAVKGK
jgi:hypothetical protein